MWSSTTQITWVPHASRDAVWSKVCKLSKPREDAPYTSTSLPVCSYALQGKCRNNAWTCKYSHDLSQVYWNGSQYVGHSTASSKVPDTSYDISSVNHAASLMASLRESDDVAYVECHGAAFDASDPLWSEVVRALCTNKEDVGCGDLPTSTRNRLAHASEYHLVDEETADEWLCLPAEALRYYLHRSGNKLLQSRVQWLFLDLKMSITLWDEIAETLRGHELLHRDDTAENFGGEGASNPDEEGYNEADSRSDVFKSIAGAAAQADSAMADLSMEFDPYTNTYTAVELGEGLYDLQAYFARTEFSQKLRASLEAMMEMERLVMDLNRERTSQYWQHSIHPLDLLNQSNWRQVDPCERNSHKLSEVHKSLERCTLLVRMIRDYKWTPEDSGWQSHASETPSRPRNPRQPSSVSTLQIRVGCVVAVTGLNANAEQSLNGQAARVERYDETLKLWQVQLEQSGTRLLLSEENMSVLPRGVHSWSRRGRSRSPRGVDIDSVTPAGVFEIAQEASKYQGLLLIHHVVNWEDRYSMW